MTENQRTTAESPITRKVSKSRKIVNIEQTRQKNLFGFELHITTVERVREKAEGARKRHISGKVW